MSTEKSIILSAQQVQQKLLRMAQELYEVHYGADEIVLIGIDETGWKIAQVLHHNFLSVSPIPAQLYKMQMDKKSIDIMPTIEGAPSLKKKTIVLIDDVVNSGRTLMHAAQFLCMQSPNQLSVAVLINREHRLFPIAANVVGLTLSTNLKEHVQVEHTQEGFDVYLQNSK
jgi:pyrimidine operon attenuation protein/uracil phosphoribosyltransferase